MAFVHDRLRKSDQDVADREPWGYLDLLHHEPFFASYKRRVRDLLALRPGLRYLDVGGGVGHDAIAVSGQGGLAVMVEPRRAHAVEAARRGISAAVVSDGAGLPFPDRTFDGCVADRVLQHVREPARIIAEMTRVLRVGGRIVTVDPDLDTQVADVDDVDLARRILRYRSDLGRPSGTVARRTGRLLQDAGLDDVTIEAYTLVVRDASSVDNVMGIRDWASFAHDAGFITADEAAAWPLMIDDAAKHGRFLYAVTYFLTTGERG